MIKKALLVTIALVVVATGSLYLFPGEEVRIQRSLRRLAASASTSEPLHAIVLASRAQKIAGAFAPECLFDTPVRNLNSSQSRQDINRMAARYLAEVKATAMEFQDVQVERTGPESAEAHTRVRAAGFLRSDDPFLEDHAVILRFQKIDGNWLIAACEVIQTYSNP